MDPAVPRRLWAGRTLALSGIVLVAGSLRSAVAALSPIASEISVDIPLDSIALGVLGMLPPVCFGLFAIVTPPLARRFSVEAALIAALAVMVAGHLMRATAGSLDWLLGGSALTFAALGVGNVLLPPLVKKYFPDRIGQLTSLYATTLALSTLLPPLIAVPVAHAAGWRTSLGQWGVLALVAIIPWVALLGRERRDARPAPVPSVGEPVVEEPDPAVFSRIWRSPIAWAIAVVFSASAINAYALFAWMPRLVTETAGVGAAEAGGLLSLYAAMGIPASLVVPLVATRMTNVGRLVYVGALAFLAGDLGLLLAPSTAPWLWVVLAGLGPLLFPLALVLINLRTRTHAGAVALSGFVQGVGYMIAGLGPLIVGVLHGTTGGWTWPLLFLISTALVVTVAGVVISRPHLLEDELERRPGR